MSKSNAAENDYLALIYNATPIANLADDAASGPLTNLYVALHSADPGEAGDQTTSEIVYTGYARVAVARPAGFTVSTNTVAFAATCSFPACTGLTDVATHFSIGVAASGASKIIHSGTLTPNITIANGTTPKIATGTIITED